MPKRHRDYTDASAPRLSVLRVVERLVAEAGCVDLINLGEMRDYELRLIDAKRAVHRQSHDLAIVITLWQTEYSSLSPARSVHRKLGVRQQRASTRSLEIARISSILTQSGFSRQEFSMLPPFMNSTGLVTKILDKIIEAKQPDRFTQDFLETKLGYSGGSARPIIGLLKRIGFLGSDGTPTPLYARFRNKEERGRAMADALAIGYKDVYARNEYAHDMPKDKFKSLIIEMTGEDASSTSVIAIVSTFFALKTYADFDAKPREDDKKLSEIVVPSTQQPSGDTQEGRRQHPTSTGLNLSYTINLNLPETTDVNVFNAIFSSLKEHLLKS